MRRMRKYGLLWALGLLGVLLSLPAWGQVPPPPTPTSLTVTIEGAGAVNVVPAGVKVGDKYHYPNPVTVALTATPAEGWGFKAWRIGPVGEDPATRTENPIEVNLTAEKPDWQATAVFVRTYTITATAGPGGKIEPSGTVTVLEGGSQTFTITPDLGYEIEDVLVDGDSVGPVSTYTFNNVTANHTIHATFKQITYTITATAGPGGKIEPSGTVTVPYGGSQTFTITPNLGYEIEDVLVDGDSVGPVSTYTFSNVTADHTIHATFKKIALYTEDFADGAPDWTKSGLWHICEEACGWCTNAPLQGKYAHYAIPNKCSYDTGRRTLGYLTSPVITVPANRELVLIFDFARVVEFYARATRDRTYVQYRLGKGSWRTAWSLSSRNEAPNCGTIAIPIKTGRYTTLQVRFVFDSVNSYNNDYPGWAVDNVRILPKELVPAGIPLAEEYVDEVESLDEEEPLFVLTVSPNPVTGRIVVFGVDGVAAEALRVEVYDLGGRLVYKAETFGGQLTWDTLDATGKPVANGVYLVLAKVKVDGEWLSADLQKILILR